MDLVKFWWGSGFYFEFQYQNYILDIEDTHRLDLQTPSKPIVHTDGTHRQAHIHADRQTIFFPYFEF